MDFSTTWPRFTLDMWYLGPREITSPEASQDVEQVYKSSNWQPLFVFVCLFWGFVCFRLVFLLKFHGLLFEMHLAVGVGTKNKDVCTVGKLENIGNIVNLWNNFKVNVKPAFFFNSSQLQKVPACVPLALLLWVCDGAIPRVAHMWWRRSFTSWEQGNRGRKGSGSRDLTSSHWEETTDLSKICLEIKSLTHMGLWKAFRIQPITPTTLTYILGPHRVRVMVANPRKGCWQLKPFFSTNF